MKTFSVFIRFNKCNAKGVEIIDSRENLIRLINQYQNLVFSICLKMTGDYFTAEDITQDTFIAAYKNWNSFDGVNEKTWICRIATNKCIDYKKAAARKVASIDDENFSDVTGSPGILPEIINKEVIKDFIKTIEKLPEPYKTVAEKHFIEGKTAKEISFERASGIKTIQTQIYRARSMLKKMIRKEELMP